ncbi:MAG: DUF402 domain-containing protein [Chloroflexi bacterium]|nr:DUF402 domain-containing protein [Chloroflexota bacterium]
MITVHKLDHSGKEKIAYSGALISRNDNEIVLEAIFKYGPMEREYATLKPGDRFVEHFYKDRWYNIFAIYEGELFKGWYCNITRPAKFEGDHIFADDLALDYFLQPNGKEFILDEEEFKALGLDSQEAVAARAALEELRSMATRGIHPFDTEYAIRNT